MHHSPCAGAQGFGAWQMASMMRASGITPRPLRPPTDMGSVPGAQHHQEEEDEEDHQEGHQAAARIAGVQRTGYLWKKGARFYDTWQRRFFLLQPQDTNNPPSTQITELGWQVVQWWVSREAWLRGAPPRNTIVLHRSQASPQPVCRHPPATPCAGLGTD